MGHEDTDLKRGRTWSDDDDDATLQLWLAEEKGWAAGHRAASAGQDEENIVYDTTDEVARQLYRKMCQVWIDYRRGWTEEQKAADDLQTALAVQRLEMQAAEIRAELGDAEIERRNKASQAAWEGERAEMHEYYREVKAARERHDPPPPHYLHNPDAWQQWRYTRRWLGQN